MSLRTLTPPQNPITVQTGAKQILIHGLALILAGLVFGFAPPLTPYPRLAVAARQAGAAGAAAWQEAVVKLCHLPAALGLILSVALLIIGIVKHRVDPV